MSLDNLVKIGKLKAHTTTPDELSDLLAAADRNLGDARVHAISVENRFDAAYKCLHQAALVGLLATGYRPDTKASGHHATVIQSLPKTIGIESERIAVLDALRAKRNLSDYTGKEVDAGSLRACIEEAERLLREVREWLRAKHPELIAQEPNPR
jgi:hypothetical protein